MVWVEVSGRDEKVVPEEKLVVTTHFPGGNTLKEMRFQPTGDGTRVTITQTSPSREERDGEREAMRSCSKLALTSFRGRSGRELFRAHQETDDPRRSSHSATCGPRRSIGATRGARWPTKPVADEGNYVDLVWHEAEHRDSHSYTSTPTTP